MKIFSWTKALNLSKPGSRDRLTKKKKKRDEGWVQKKPLVGGG